ncbi:MULTISPECIES: DUF732 domain-containing protein [Mycobacterium]|uniref:DUF732 domain-containing protein n=1 Tax=Mycobacterium indicus pranii (strain DSM 45239 / MTCC 9506) TaxID=1232724 RepID=J9WFR2_MYCIP|nr:MULTISPECIES: DUF732 domain-containing protein [Mycobacterium]AFS16099.1 Hypothetical protein MIP_06093 [Mycobacterium intracellulare subsp. intracellulare MTCC 9506]WSE52510.1 DUF732 domain-containing protein [Mycobacterium sp. 2-64]BCO53666.1 hypothetical protein MINTM003_41070 [Mycobacterium paraintracellulare]BCO90937.1 hypothetical protein MINTM015_41940 [Mycobacterium paraintracellulare]
MKIYYVAPLGMLASIFVAAPAHADTTQFLADVQNAGFTDGSFGATGLAEMGAAVCAQMDQGMDPVAVAQQMYADTPVNFTQDETDHFVAIAIRDLCPQHIAQVARDAQEGT